MSQIERQEIHPGVILEKEMIKQRNKKYLIMKIELQIFNIVEVKVDFTGSENIKIGKGKQMEVTIEAQPFAKMNFVKIKLKSNWNLNTVFYINSRIPPMDVQERFLLPILEKDSIENRKAKVLRKIDFTNSNDDDIFTYLSVKDFRFVDSEFKPTYESLGIDEEIFKDVHGCMMHWRRIKYIFMRMKDVNKVQALPYLFKKGISSLDIKLGNISFSWLISAIGSLAERPYLIDRLFKTKRANDYGVYRLKICQMGFWQSVIIDDYFPCFPLGDPFFDYCFDLEIWVLIIEKCMAKLFGSYNNLSKGNCLDGLIDFTNCPSFEIPFVQYQDKNKLWADIKKWLDYDYVISVAAIETDVPDEINASPQELTYAILKYYEGDGVRLLKIRNLWGIFSWKGDWSVKSKFWTEHMKEKVKPGYDLNEKIFWIDFDNFQRNFHKLYVSYVRNWHEIKIKGKFVKAYSEQNQDITWCSKWAYRFTLEKREKIVLGLHQEDEKVSGVKQTRRYVDMGMDLIKMNGDHPILLDQFMPEIKRDIYLEKWLDKGEYLLVPKSSGIDFCQENPFKDQHFDYSPQNPIFKAILRDLFQKFDHTGEQKLNFAKLRNFFKIVNEEMNEEEFNQVSNEYGDLLGVNKGYLTEISFVKYFVDYFDNLDKELIISIFERLGYETDLTNRKLKVFTFSIYSSSALEVQVKNSLRENYNSLSYQLELRKLGEIYEFVGDKNDKVKILRLINRQFKKQIKYHIFWSIELKQRQY